MPEPRKPPRELRPQQHLRAAAEKVERAANLLYEARTELLLTLVSLGDPTPEEARRMAEDGVTHELLIFLAATAAAGFDALVPLASRLQGAAKTTPERLRGEWGALLSGLLDRSRG